MAIPVEDVLRKLPRRERKAIETRRRELLAEYMTLQDLRKARELTQQRMAELLGIKQANVSRIEKRSDLLLSTLGSYVAAMGGRLRLVAEFPDRPPVVLSKLSDESEVRSEKSAAD
ncbi:MAG TPA: XRE family transcriptional regulator [Geminicoccaceae bacterium]|nr:XRE family transcriptional regulator [Geminicoccaceae bacterium]